MKIMKMTNLIHDLRPCRNHWHRDLRDPYAHGPIESTIDELIHELRPSHRSLATPHLASIDYRQRALWWAAGAQKAPHGPSKFCLFVLMTFVLDPNRRHGP